MSCSPTPQLELRPDAIGRELTAVGVVRRAVRDFLHDEHIDAGDDVLLVVSELVTNSMIHTHDAPAVVVRHQRRPECIAVEVTDRSPALPTPRSPDGAPGGRGLHIVEQLASAWGVRRSCGCKTTWATVPVVAARR